jgi:hypothetical protein
MKFPPKRRLLQKPHGVTSQKTPFFIVTAVKTSNLKNMERFRIGTNGEPFSVKDEEPYGSRKAKGSFAS